MKIAYGIKIREAQSHYLHVSMQIKYDEKSKNNLLNVFIPSWSPGSYLMREYGKHIRKFKALNTRGEYINFKQVDKGVYELDLSNSDLGSSIDITYDVYCHDLTVRTSFIDISHAFLHGPTFLMGVKEFEINNPTLKVEFPALWSKISTGLKDISTKREEFLYTAKNYDELIDSPLEIGCQETDGFMVDKIPHNLCFYGSTVKHQHNLKADIKTLCETVYSTMGELPFKDYTFITHFVPGIYGGLEHLNSTALQFDSFEMNSKKGYTKWLELVVHEYFHAWNVKRIRPKELGPFNYLEEAKTRMHWLTEGLTSFMDQLFVLRSGLIQLDDYLEMMTDNLNRLESIPGKKFDSLEDSSFNAWIKLYRPDENSINSSVSYYLKGGLVFFVLNILLFEKGKLIDDLLKKLWEHYKERPLVGLESNEVYQMIEDLAGEEVREKFELMITTTEDIDFESFLKLIGIDINYSDDTGPYLGANFEYKNNNVFIKSVILDGPSYKYGLNAGDEVIAIDGLRIKKSNITDFSKWAIVDKMYSVTVSRKGVIETIDIKIGQLPRKIKSLSSKDQKLTLKALVR